MKLSIIVPVYNEEKTVEWLLKKLVSLKIPKVEKEIIVVDDGSVDTTVIKISRIRSKTPSIKLIKHKQNQGKGSAIKTGLERVTGDYIVIQDADLEYNPLDIVKLIQPIKEKKMQVVYGTRLRRWPNFSRRLGT